MSVVLQYVTAGIKDVAGVAVSVARAVYSVL